MQADKDSCPRKVIIAPQWLQEIAQIWPEKTCIPAWLPQKGQDLRFSKIRPPRFQIRWIKILYSQFIGRIFCLWGGSTKGSFLFFFGLIFSYRGAAFRGKKRGNYFSDRIRCTLLRGKVFPFHWGDKATLLWSNAGTLVACFFLLPVVCWCISRNPFFLL